MIRAAQALKTPATEAESPIIAPPLSRAAAGAATPTPGHRERTPGHRERPSSEPKRGIANRDALGFDLDDLVATAAAGFRSHPHVGNVMTHLCGARWERIGQAVRTILDPRSEPADLSPLAENIVELMCGERGVTGRIFKPWFGALLGATLPAPVAARLSAHIADLYRAMVEKARLAAEPAAAPVRASRPKVRFMATMPRRMVAALRRALRRLSRRAGKWPPPVGTVDLAGRPAQDPLEAMWAAASLGLGEYPDWAKTIMEKRGQAGDIAHDWRM